MKEEIKTRTAVVKIVPNVVFGRLTVIKYHGKDIKGHSSLWECMCECGSKAIVNSGLLRSGKTTSCGCYRREFASKQFTTHGLHGHRLYTIYKGMKQRCNNTTNGRYGDYGGRGIKICDEWMSNFVNFFNWAVSNKYADDLTIERIDNNKGYSPDNCKWIPANKQSQNRRCNHELTFNGQTKTISEWSRELGGNFNLVYRRIKRGWSIEKSLTTRNTKEKEVTHV